MSRFFPVITTKVIGVHYLQRAIGVCYFVSIFGTPIGAPITAALRDTYGWPSAIQFAGATTTASGLAVLLLRFIRRKQLRLLSKHFLHR